MCDGVSELALLAGGAEATGAAALGTGLTAGSAGLGLSAGAAGLGLSAGVADVAFSGALASGMGATSSIFGAVGAGDLLSAGLSMGKSLIEGDAKEAQARYEAGVASNNALSAEYAAADARRRGELDAQRVNRNASQLMGKQRAELAARGLDIAEGTPGDILDQTNFFGQIDANTARYNGQLEAWQNETKAVNYRAQAGAAYGRVGAAKTGSLLSGAASVADRWLLPVKKT